MLSEIADEIRELIDRHQTWIKRIIAARTLAAEMVEDVFAEVLLAVAKSTDRPTSDVDLRPWLCKIAIRQAALANRTAMRRERLARGYSETICDVDSSTDPITWLLSRERDDMLRQVLNEMDESAKRLLIGKYVRRRTYAQLGREMSVAEHVVEYRLAQAKKQLRSMLTERGLGRDDVT